MVVDNSAPGKQRRRFLAYDMMALFGGKLVDRPFVDRIALIQSHVVHPRNLFLVDAGKSASYNFSKEPFSIRQKDFFPLSGTEGTIRTFIPKLTHECDGLIFQPSRMKYLTVGLGGAGVFSLTLTPELKAFSTRRERRADSNLDLTFCGVSARGGTAPRGRWTRCSSGNSRT
jgi:hypothetical protein